MQYEIWIFKSHCHLLPIICANYINENDNILYNIDMVWQCKDNSHYNRTHLLRKSLYENWRIDWCFIHYSASKIYTQISIYYYLLNFLQNILFTIKIYITNSTFSIHTLDSILFVLILTDKKIARTSYEFDNLITLAYCKKIKFETLSSYFISIVIIIFEN